MHKFLAKLHTGLLVFAALGGIVIGGADAIGVPIHGLKDVASYILVLVGLLALSNGLERWVVIRGTEERLDDILSQLRHMKQSDSVRVLDSYDEVYDMGCKCIREAKREIRAVVAVGSLTAPEKYRNTLVEILAASKKINQPIHNHIVVASPSLPLPVDVLTKFNERNKFYEESGIDDQVSIYFTVAPASFDMLIVDEKHLLLSYTVVRGASKVQTGMVFLDQPRIASEMARWFDNALLPRSTPADRAPARQITSIPPLQPVGDGTAPPTRANATATTVEAPLVPRRR